MTSRDNSSSRRFSSIKTNSKLNYYNSGYLQEKNKLRSNLLKNKIQFNEY
jgi:hypothetical protein